jgi:hypothetical protein
LRLGDLLSAKALGGCQIDWWKINPAGAVIKFFLADD